MQSPTSSKLNPKKLSLLSLLTGLMDWSMEKKWRRDWNEQFKPCSIFQGPFPPSHSIFVRDTCPPPKQTTPWTWNSVPSLENSWKMFVFRFRFHIKLQLCTFLHVFSNATVIRKFNDYGTKLGFCPWSLIELKVSSKTSRVSTGRPAEPLSPPRCFFQVRFHCQIHQTEKQTSHVIRGAHWLKLETNANSDLSRISGASSPFPCEMQSLSF